MFCIGYKEIFNIFLRIFSQGLEYTGDQWLTPSWSWALAAPWAWGLAASWYSSWSPRSPACSTPSWGAPGPGPWYGHQPCWQMSDLRKCCKNNINEPKMSDPQIWEKKSYLLEQFVRLRFLFAQASLCTEQIAPELNRSPWKNG